ncbi:DUF6009 family protein [Streptomyces sp. enrichment culture]|uniref:DUF6009 family protein n=1 Tax=Streptomyces sp. enrichment culture TaxID=1795815 RepID=UPI003F55A80D
MPDRAKRPVRSRTSATFCRRVFWLLPHERDSQPDGLRQQRPRVHTPSIQRPPSGP